MPAGRLSTPPVHSRPRRSSSFVPQADPNDAESMISDVTNPFLYNDTTEVKRNRTKAPRKPPSRPRKESKSDMESHTWRRSNSYSKVYLGNDFKSKVHEVHSRDGSRQRHRPHRSERADGGANNETVYVYHRRRGSMEEMDTGRSSALRRSKTTDANSRPGHERSRKEADVLDRRRSERRSERRDPRYVEESGHTRLRREKRSITENVPRRHRDGAPIR